VVVVRWLFGWGNWRGRRVLVLVLMMGNERSGLVLAAGMMIHLGYYWDEDEMFGRESTRWLSLLICHRWRPELEPPIH